MEIRGAAAPVGTAYCDLLQPDTLPRARQAQRELGGFDTVVVTAGMFASQERLENDPQLAARLLAADFTNTVLFCEEASKRLHAEKGDRPFLWEAAFSAPPQTGVPPAARSASSARWPASGGEAGHPVRGGEGRAFAVLGRAGSQVRAQGLRTMCVKPGFVKTGMTVGLKPPPFAGTPEEVARRVLKAMDRGWPEVYVPWTWRWVMCVIRGLPRFVMRRIEF